MYDTDAVAILQVGSIRWLLAQPDPRAAFQKLKAGGIREAASAKHSLLSVLTEQMPGVYSMKCLRRAFCYELVEEIERRADTQTAPQNLVRPLSSAATAALCVVAGATLMPLYPHA